MGCRLLRLCALGWALVSSFGCAAGAKPAPEPLASNSHQYGVFHENRKSLSFGEYKVVDIRRKWKKQTLKSVFLKHYDESKQDFSFKMYRGDVLSTTTCHRETAVAAGIRDKEQLLCQIDGVPDGNPWNIVVAQGTGEGVTGRLIRSGVEIQIRGDRPTSVTRPRNFLFGSESEVAAVDTGPSSETIWMSTALDPHQQYAVAAAASALMVYDDLR